MLTAITEKLKEIEELYHVRVLYACESGSRAWGFPSPDSDFDVRFIYARNINEYLTIVEKADTIELPVNEVLDIGGWDIRKALKLFLKSNAPLFEWLQSPIIYKNDPDFTADLQGHMSKYFSLRAGGHHYFSMATNTFNDDLQTEQVKIKRCFYGLRSALACKWIAERQTFPPMELSKLRVIINDQGFQTYIDALLAQKFISDEKTLVPRSERLNDWIEITLDECKKRLTNIPATHNQADELDALFRKYIV
jgi:predicted nucleotidyltransferase